ncbi:MAG: hypothetical protein ACTSPB_22560, partial [Candidatus Thorarchaeota archaeon]
DDFENEEEYEYWKEFTDGTIASIESFFTGLEKNYMELRSWSLYCDSFKKSTTSEFIEKRIHLSSIITLTDAMAKTVKESIKNEKRFSDFVKKMRIHQYRESVIDY